MFFLWFIIIGITAGFIAGYVMRGGGFGIFVNLLVGIAGSILGGWMFNLLDISANSLLGSLACSTTGAIILLWIASLFKKH
ncbi:MAG: GlsB/YeaQ/YmgE family stress response membrane protein [Bacteroides sp.]|nr:GlsB/YeaQ/YmgE family stress response membrane protein [Roseburia sp.]MCM1346696.1 GlsB/YeaQ/YmgE family stress response membrane protein [Bacteroides sp.]MCM1419944.1 GlsB/YeaQ/YmgE family stress response membrane protein [Bacteroides sp.]